MNVAPPISSARKAKTQPLGWDWVTDWIALDTSLRELEQRHCWNWRRDLDEITQDMDQLSAR
jgi:hypothetical protein